MANKAYRYRLYPTAEQCTLLSKTFGCCRKVWNLMLSDKISYYKETGKNLSVTPAMYKKDYPFLKEVDSLALANVQMHLQAAYKNFFQNKKTGFPKFKSAKRSRKSYTTNCVNGSIRIEGNRIRLPKLGLVKAVVHRVPPADWKVKSATVSQESDGTFYVSVLFEYGKVIVPVSKDSKKVLGLDYKSDGLYMDSEGRKGSEHKYYRESLEKLAKAQRKLKNKKPGSSNYKKQQQRIARIYRHTSSQRKDHLHKLSTEIANQYEIVCVEDLDMKAIANKGFGNGRATMDNGYGMFLSMLEYKLRERGKYLVRVDKWYPSSQLCHCCGRRKKLSLEERVYSCVCGYTGDRDHNAAINIKKEGLRLLKEAA